MEVEQGVLSTIYIFVKLQYTGLSNPVNIIDLTKPLDDILTDIEAIIKAYNQQPFSQYDDIPSFAITMFCNACNAKASEVHIKPTLTIIRIRFRVDRLQKSMQHLLSSTTEQNYSSHLKVLANLIENTAPAM